LNSTPRPPVQYRAKAWIKVCSPTECNSVQPNRVQQIVTRKRNIRHNKALLAADHFCSSRNCFANQIVMRSRTPPAVIMQRPQPEVGPSMAELGKPGTDAVTFTCSVTILRYFPVAHASTFSVRSLITFNAGILRTLLWWACRDSNPEPRDYEFFLDSVSIPTEPPKTIAKYNKPPARKEN
jgi:hypothetical protein